MNKRIKFTALLIACAFGMAVNAAIPEAIQKTWDEMKANDVDSRAGYSKSLGVYVIAKGSVEITGSKAKAKTIAALRASLEKNGNLTGFLGCSWLMDTLCENGMQDLAVKLLLNHSFPSWLYSVDQGATTVWERWNGWTIDKGFGPVSMNSYNHYAYGNVLAWMYRHLAGIAPESAAPGFRKIVMKPVFDKRLGYVKAEYKSAAGLIKSAWRYEGDTVVWEFTIPEGATAEVFLTNDATPKIYLAGTYRVRSGAVPGTTR